MVFQKHQYLIHAPIVSLRNYNGSGSLTVEVNGEWIAYDLDKFEAALIFNTAILTLEKIGYQVRIEGKELL